MEDNFALAWDDDSSVAVVQEEGHVVEEVICDIENEILPGDGNDDFVAEEVCGEEQHSGGDDDEDAAASTNDVTPEEIIEENEQVDHEDIVYLTHDNVVVMQSVGQSTATVAYPEQVAFQEQTFQEHFMEECQVSEEVVTDHWDQSCPEEIIVGSEQAVGGSEEQPNEDFDIPLPTDQDEYTASRPYPCDFCSRRFRKKANLMNHMVAHQTDRPHGCNLCGASYIRKSDLMNHLKIHAYVPETDGLDEEDVLPLDESDVERMPTPRRNKPSKRTKKNRTVKEEIVNSYEVDDAAASGSRSYNYVDEDMRLMEAMENTKEYAEYTEYMEESQPMELRYPITDPKKPFVCQHCGVGFAREKALASHARVHGGDSPFECQKCGEMFWDISQMREHVRQKHGGDVEGDLDDGGEDEDEDYSEGEESTKYGTFYCSTCGLSFHRQDNLKRHLRIHVKEEFVNDHEFGHVCNVCGGSFPEALDLLAHAEIHTRTSEHRCMICGEVCPDDQALPMHVKTKHGKNLPPNTCLLCGRACKDRRTLLKHSWEHSKEKTFACSKCAKTFHNKARLKRHMLSHRNKVVACDVCGEEFPDGRTLMNHRHSHSSLSGRQFPCRECGKTFGSRSSQQIHIRIHTGERPYGCRFCWKAFADGGTLRKHERIHTGEKPYACAVCPRAFNQRVVLREHIRSHHSGPDPKYTHSVTPYCCQVCSDMFATSQDLIIHLIHHCDLNTAMKRQPQVGPRKYKRRRKLKPHELEMISNKADDEIEEEEEEHIYYESDSDREYQHRKKQSPVAAPVPKKAKKNSSSPKPSLNDTYTELYNSCSSALENINAIVNSKSSSAGKSKRKTNKTDPPVPSRPKMIHTQKTRVPVESSEDGRVRHKTRTLVTRTQPAELRSAIGERIRPRTKNVSYHILTGKPSVATFPDDATEQAVNNLLREESILNNDSAAESVGEQLRQEDEEQQQYHRKQVVEKQEQHNAQQQPQSNGQVYTDQHHRTIDRHPSPAASVPEVASEQIVETADDSAGPVPTNIIRITSAPTPLHNLRPGRHLIGPGGKLVRLVKGGMIIAKHKDKKAIEPEKILPDVGNAASRSAAAPGGDDATTTIINRANPEPVNIKQEIVEASPLHELAELSMQHAQNMFKCEMCSAVFSDRAKLLDHVSIHI